MIIFLDENLHYGNSLELPHSVEKARAVSIMWMCLIPLAKSASCYGWSHIMKTIKLRSYLMGENRKLCVAIFNLLEKEIFYLSGFDSISILP